MLCLVARVRNLALELASASGSGPESYISWLERAFLRSSVLLGCRPEASNCWLEQDFLRSSEGSLCLVARATTPSLERATNISVGSSGITHHFFHLFTSQTLDSAASLSTLNFSLGFHLFLVCCYPKFFVRKVEGVEGFLLI